MVSCCSEKKGKHCLTDLGRSQNSRREESSHLPGLLNRRDKDAALSSKVRAKGSRSPAGVAHPNCASPLPPASSRPTGSAGALTLDGDEYLKEAGFTGPPFRPLKHTDKHIKGPRHYWFVPC